MSLLFRFPDARKRDPEIEAWFSTQEGELAAMAKHWFAHVRNCGGEVRELMHDGRPTACVRDAAFAYIDVHTSHVTLGFFRGATFADPSNVLEGSGTFMRHVKLRLGHALDEPALLALIETAYWDMLEHLK